MDSLSLAGNSLVGFLKEQSSAIGTRSTAASLSDLRSDAFLVSSELAIGLSSRNADVRLNLGAWQSQAEALQGASRYASESRARFDRVNTSLDRLETLTRQANATDDEGLRTIFQSSIDREVTSLETVLSPARHGTPEAYGGAVAHFHAGVSITLPGALGDGGEVHGLSFATTADQLGSTSGLGSIADLLASSDGTSAGLVNAESLIAAARDEVSDAHAQLDALNESLSAYDQSIESTLGNVLATQSTFRALTLDALFTTLDLANGSRTPAGLSDAYSLLGAQSSGLATQGIASLLA